MADTIVVRGAREHNLRDVSLELPRDRLIVLTGLSGSGKSSLAFDTIYAEGQRRYVESLSSYARQFLGQMDKPDVDFIEGLSPAISIDQKSAGRNPRSTVGTITEIYDYLRLLYARIGVPHCPRCGRVIARQTPQQIVDRILELPEGTRFQVLAPVVRGRKGDYETLLGELASEGFSRARVDGEVRELGAPIRLERYEQHTIEVVVDRLVRRRRRAAPDRLLGDRPSPGRGSGRGRARGPAGRWWTPSGGVPDPDLQPAPGLRCLRLVVRRARTPQLLVQLPYGACPTCDGLGTRYEVDPELVVPNPDLSVAEGAVAPFSTARTQYFERVLEALADTYGFSLRALEAAQEVTAEGRSLRVRVQEAPGRVQEPLRPRPVVPHRL